ANASLLILKMIFKSFTRAVMIGRRLKTAIRLKTLQKKKTE
ncbi:MAG: hypothetical protein ACI9Z9_002966, partial [Litorivivens sp.]